MTETEKAFIDGWEQARKQAVLAVSMIPPEGKAQEIYQRLAVNAVNAVPCPVGDARPSSQRASVVLDKWDALRARHPRVEEREPGDDDGEMLA